MAPVVCLMVLRGRVACAVVVDSWSIEVKGASDLAVVASAVSLVRFSFVRLSLPCRCAVALLRAALTWFLSRLGTGLEVF
ncbi:MAG: hypothetical protein AAGB12_16680 [Pseudomonadota bacterium]